ncbi:calcium/sodium antiporter [Marinovum sp.]|uniref:calcium/sodium antiporter n=1 Tax=Marinovum sp. TaxID=2024839 RepID=UPI002B26C606|nr:calcium/sodium antiporter [Marinovum sp.]
MMVWLLCALGLIILVLAGDALVKGAVNLALRVGIPALIVSLTIVAFGTSAPELLIAIQAVMQNAPGIAMGNVVGSNTANILLVLGVPAIISGLHTSQCDSRKTYVQMLVASALFIGLAFFGVFAWWSALILLAALGGMLFHASRVAMRHRRDTRAAETVDRPEGADPDMSWPKIAMFLLLGLVGLPLGADLLVENASVIARRYGVSDTVIGLTLVAVGTSLPELATTVAAALRKQADVALGNVIGSNMFNLLAIIGVAALIRPIPVDAQFLSFDLWVMLVASLLIFPFVFLRWDMGRAWGVALTALYVGYVVMVIV